MVRGWLVLGLAVGLMVSGCAAGETESPAEAFLSGASLEEGWVARLEPDQQLGYGGGFMNMLAVTDFGVVAVGCTCESVDESNTSADCTPAAWVSERGADWTKVYGQDAGLVEGTMFGVTAGGPGVVGVGSTCAVMPLPEGCAPAIWTSADGHVWE
jgi:hypothetical protein